MPTVSGTVSDSAGNVANWSTSWTVASQQPLKVIGMSAPSGSWSTRLSEVGPVGVKARRIFCNLTSAGTDQSSLISQAVAAGMMPVCSYKVPSVATLISGGYDTWLTALRNYLNGLGVTVAATFWHEPHGDMTAQQFRDGSTKFLAVKSPMVKVGPLLNGWLLDNQLATFEGYTSAALLDAWDWVGIDSYQSGDVNNPGSNYPADRMGPLAAFLASKGKSTMPIGVGEYNGFDTSAIIDMGEALLSTPQVWFGCVWNSSGGLGIPLTGARLTAYQATKADPRALA